MLLKQAGSHGIQSGIMNDPSQMMNRNFGMWQPQQKAQLPPLPPQPSAAAVAEEQMGFQNPRSVFPTSVAKPGRSNWNNKKRKKTAAAAGAGAVGAVTGVLPAGGGGAGISGYRPPTITELQYQNRLKARRFYPKKKFSRFAPFAPRNTTSFIIRAKKSGGIASLVSPCPVTPAILPTPTFSPSREGLVDMAKEEWGVDGYGSMKGLIRLRSPTAGGSRGHGGVEEEDDVDDGSSESDVEEHVEVERRLDHDLSRFEIVYPSFGEEQGGATSAAYLLENRVDDQDTHIAQLEEENLTLKERLFLMEREMDGLRRRLILLETDYRSHNERNNNNNNNNEQHGDRDDDLNAKEEASENDGGGDVCSEKSAGDCEESRGIPLQE